MLITKCNQKKKKELYVKILRSIDKYIYIKFFSKSFQKIIKTHEKKSQNLIKTVKLPFADIATAHPNPYSNNKRIGAIEIWFKPSFAPTPSKQIRCSEKVLFYSLRDDKRSDRRKVVWRS